MLERGTVLVPPLAAVHNIVGNRDKGIPMWAVEKAERVYEIHKVAFRRFYEAGGKIAMGTDAGTPFNLHGENARSEEHTSELQSLMRISYAVFCLKKKNQEQDTHSI